MLKNLLSDIQATDDLPPLHASPPIPRTAHNIFTGSRNYRSGRFRTVVKFVLATSGRLVYPLIEK